MWEVEILDGEDWEGRDAINHARENGWRCIER